MRDELKVLVGGDDRRSDANSVAEILGSERCFEKLFPSGTAFGDTQSEVQSPCIRLARIAAASRQGAVDRGLEPGDARESMDVEPTRGEPPGRPT